MNKLRIYLDTSIVNFLFAEDAPDFRRVTEDFFAVHAQKYELFASEVVVLENWIYCCHGTSNISRMFAAKR